MAHSARKPGAKKARKGILRKMKTLLKRIGRHASRHRDLLENHYEQTKLSQAQGESAGGLIVDYMLYGKGAPSEGKK
jgi:hypothetical protein